jgi:hypothetical protein
VFSLIENGGNGCVTVLHSEECHGLKEIGKEGATRWIGMSSRICGNFIGLWNSKQKRQLRSGGSFAVKYKTQQRPFSGLLLTSVVQEVLTMYIKDCH